MIRERIVGRANRQAAERQQLKTRGAVDINKVDQALYREDLGFNMTNSGYEKYSKDVADFNAGYGQIISSNQSAIEQNKANLKSANEFISSTANESIENWWNKAQETFVPVDVAYVGGKDYAGSYRLPKDVIPQLQAQGLFVYPVKWGSNGRATGWIDVPIEQAEKVYITPTIKGGGSGNKYPKEVNNAISGVANQVKSAFYEQALPKYQELQTNVNTAITKKGELEKAIGDSTVSIEGANNQKALIDTTRAEYKKQYDESKAHRQALLAPQPQKQLEG